MQGIFDFEFIGNLSHKCFALGEITVFRQIRKPPHFSPIHRDDSSKIMAISFFAQSRAARFSPG